MTNEEAYKYLEDRLRCHLFNSEEVQAIQIAIKALGKQISKKPFKDNGDFICPSCGTYYNMRHGYDHCTQCGQHLEWGENK